MRYAYFPGCSLEHSAAAYDLSTRAVAAQLGLELVEIDDWNCCGATEYKAINLAVAYALSARNLALVEPGLDQVIAPCSACYLNLRTTDHSMAQYPSISAQVKEALAADGLSYQPGRLQVRHLLDAIVNDVGLEAIAARVRKPLYGLRLAPYYGCMIVRPGDGFDSPEYPQHLDRLLKALGAEVLDFPLKAHCCGGHMAQISPETAYHLLHRLLQGATNIGADLIVTLCPMCQLNLDAYQGHVNRHLGTDFHLPVLFFTQMMGLAFGLEAKVLGISREMVPAAPVLEAKWRDEPPPVEKPKRRPRRDRRALPMPSLDVV